MARFRHNSVEGERDETRTGWKSRRRSSRRRNGTPQDSARAAQARAALIAAAQQESDFNPEVQTSAPADGDYVRWLSDADLAALYEQLLGKPPHGRSKRASVERAVREAQAAARQDDGEADEAGDEEIMDEDA